MDSFGSNATPMGGSAGRCDAMVGAVESQKADGVLHVHLFLYLQMAMQFMPLHDLADKLRDGLLSTQSIKQFVSYVRCASYPDVDAFKEGRGAAEKAWPSYAKDTTLPRLPRFFWTTPAASGETWLDQYNARLQHSLVHKNHHIHPLVNPTDDPSTGDRRSLPSCRPKVRKGKKSDDQVCKAGFPLDNLLTQAPLVVCECIAQHRNLPTRGHRSMLGEILPARNDAWLNAGPRALLAFTAEMQTPNSLFDYRSQTRRTKLHYML